MSNIKITALTNIGSNISYTTLLPVVNMSGTPETQKANLQILGNHILNNAGGSYFASCAKAIVAETVANAAQPNITSVGTLTGLSVNGNIVAANITANTGVFTGNGSGLTNLAGGNVSGAVAFATTANSVAGSNVSGAVAFATTANSVAGSNVSGQVSNSLVAGTVYTNAQPNITSVGTLTNLAVTGNVNTSNLSAAGYISANGVINAVPAAGITSGTLTATQRGQCVLAISDVTVPANIFNTGDAVSIYNNTSGNINIIQGNSLTLRQVGTLDTGNRTLSQYGFCTIWFSSTNEAVISGSIGDANYAAFAGNVVFGSQPNITSVGTLSSLTVAGNVTANNFIGNIAGNIIGNIVGIYSNGTSNVDIPVANGNINTSVGGVSNVFVVTSTGVNIAGTLNSTGNANVGNISAINGVFTNISGNGSQLSSITGGNVSGQVSNSLVAGTVYTNTQPNITSVGTLTGLSVNGNIVAANITANTGVFTGNGSGLSNLAGGNVSGAVAFATTANSVAGSNVSGQVSNSLVAGTVYTNAQPNITSVGTLTSLGVTGNVTSGNVYANSGTIGASLLTGTLTTASQPNITSIGTLSSLSVTGNVTAGNIVGIFANGNSNISIPAANGNITFATAGSERMRISNTGAVTINQPSSGNALTVNGNLQTTGNITTSNYLINSVQTGISASGSTQGTATVLGNTINVVSIVSSGANGVRLPTAIAGMTIYITNTTANSLNVYPDSGASINFSSINVPLSQGANSTIHYIASSPTRWYSVGATYA